MEKWKKRFVDLMSSLAFGSEGNPAVIPYAPQKTEISRGEDRFFPRAVPEKHGISSRRIFNMLCELEGEGRSNVHNLMVIANGEVICECSRDGYGVNLRHLSHSMAKSVTGLLIGMLCDDGLLRLDERVADIFPEYTYKDKRFSQMTVEHLLTMKSGASFNEAGSVSETLWTEAFFSSPLKFTPGTRFFYNSLNSYILARIVDRRSGIGFSRYIGERLLIPLGITNYFWEKSPEGVEKGGWGLYISTESYAKLGQLFLEGGTFLGGRIVSEDFIKSAGTVKAISPGISGDFNYGYHTWVARTTDEKLFNGMLGQNVWICPRNNIVVAVTGGNNELFQDSPTLEIIRKYLGCEMRDELHMKDIRVLHEKETRFFDCRRWVRQKDPRRGILYFLGVRRRKRFDSAWSDALGSYALGSNNVGMLPLIVRAMQNNLDSSLETLTLSQNDDTLILTFSESGTEYSIPVGLYEYKSTVWNIRGEKYLVRAMGEAFVNSDGVCEYRIELIFPELPNTRMIKLVRIGEDRVKITLSEIPNNRIVENLMSRLSEINPAVAFGIDLVERRFGEGIVASTLRNTFSPTLIGADTARDGYRDIVAEETRRASEESRTVRLIRSVVDRFFKDDDEKNDGDKVPKFPKKERRKIAKEHRKNK